MQIFVLHRDFYFSFLSVFLFSLTLLPLTADAVFWHIAHSSRITWFRFRVKKHVQYLFYCLYTIQSIEIPCTQRNENVWELCGLHDEIVDLLTCQHRQIYNRTEQWNVERWNRSICEHFNSTTDCGAACNWSIRSTVIDKRQVSMTGNFNSEEDNVLELSIRTFGRILIWDASISEVVLWCEFVCVYYIYIYFCRVLSTLSWHVLKSNCRNVETFFVFFLLCFAE